MIVWLESLLRALAEFVGRRKPRGADILANRIILKFVTLCAQEMLA
jgi:hypothetical protein